MLGVPPEIPQPPDASAVRFGKLALGLCLVGLVFPVAMAAYCMLTGSLLDLWIWIGVFVLTGCFELPALIMGIIGWKSRAGKAAVITAVVLPLLLVAGGVILYPALHDSSARARGVAASQRVEGEFPRSEIQVANNHSVLISRDRVKLHYALFHEGRFETSVDGSHNTHSLTWIDKGSIRLTNGRTFGYLRESVSEVLLRVNGQEFDLRQGRVLVLRDDGTVVQRALFPALAVARNLDELSKLIASAAGPGKATPDANQKPSAETPPGAPGVEAAPVRR